MKKRGRTPTARPAAIPRGRWERRSTGPWRWAWRRPPRSRRRRP
jgi:hypothetical protein